MSNGFSAEENCGAPPARQSWKKEGRDRSTVPKKVVKRVLGGGKERPSLWQAREKN